MRREGENRYFIGSKFSGENTYLYFEAKGPERQGLRYNTEWNYLEHSDNGEDWYPLAYRPPLVFSQKGNEDPREHYLQGYVYLQKVGHNSAVDTIAWEVALDTPPLRNYILLDSLSALQTWINQNIRGDCTSGTRFVLRAVPQAKGGRNNEELYVRLYLLESFYSEDDVNEDIGGGGGILLPIEGELFPR